MSSIAKAEALGKQAREAWMKENPDTAAADWEQFKKEHNWGVEERNGMFFFQIFRR
jgi:hypothetical protein